MSPSADLDPYPLLAAAGLAPPPAPAPAAAPRKARPHACQYRYVRKVKGRKYQARVWVGEAGGGSLNLGLYPTELDAWTAVKRWLSTGELPAGVLPKYVRRRRDGRFVGKCRKGGEVFVVGPYRTPERAHRAMVRLLAAEFPAGAAAEPRTLFSPPPRPRPAA